MQLGRTIPNGSFILLKDKWESITVFVMYLIAIQEDR